MSQEHDPETVFAAWYANLKRYGGFPARGTIGGALVVLERLRQGLPLDIEAHTARGGAQIVGASGAAVASILARFGETRPFLSEGGRTNRGLRGDIAGMLGVLAATGLGQLPDDARDAHIAQLQRFLVDRVRDYHNRQRLRVLYDPAKSTWQFIHDFLRVAREVGKEGQVAQYLVGAKLQLRFPNLSVGNHLASTADTPSGRRGDFAIGRTVFHVTVSPMGSVYEKSQRDLDAGYRVYLLVADEAVVGAKQLAEATSAGRISVESIETFVAQNLDELTTFGEHDPRSQIRQLLETYNRRVDAIETDKSLLIEFPPNITV
jgi:hypothetical protein